MDVALVKQGNYFCTFFFPTIMTDCDCTLTRVGYMVSPDRVGLGKSADRQMLKWKHRDSLTRRWRDADTVLCGQASTFIHCLQPRKACPNMTEKMLTKT